MCVQVVVSDLCSDVTDVPDPRYVRHVSSATEKSPFNASESPHRSPGLGSGCRVSPFR